MSVRPCGQSGCKWVKVVSCILIVFYSLSFALAVSLGVQVMM